MPFLYQQRLCLEVAFPNKKGPNPCKGRLHVRYCTVQRWMQHLGLFSVTKYHLLQIILFRRQEWMGIIWFSQWTLKTPFQLSILHIQQLGMTPLHGFFNRKPHPVVSWGTPEIFHVEVFVSFRHFHGIRHDSERKKHQWKLVRWVAMWS